MLNIFKQRFFKRPPKPPDYTKRELILQDIDRLKHQRGIIQEQIRQLVQDYKAEFDG